MFKELDFSDNIDAALDGKIDINDRIMELLNKEYEYEDKLFSIISRDAIEIYVQLIAMKYERSILENIRNTLTVKKYSNSKYSDLVDYIHRNVKKD